MGIIKTLLLSVIGVFQANYTVNKTNSSYGKIGYYIGEKAVNKAKRKQRSEIATNKRGRHEKDSFVFGNYDRHSIRFSMFSTKPVKKAAITRKSIEATNQTTVAL